ncbi:MAG TPA: GRP family sugar transporter [Candidatus Limnocylindrales bacterium]|nr:GRP family sugar transporter [Candidatus Limnocylindrales bacterium]
MFIPHTYLTALVLMLFSMLCWGSWANTQKIDKRWRFELFYWDYILGLLLCAVLFGLTLGSRNSTSPDSFFRNLGTASPRSLIEAFLGGAIFNLGNLLLVAAISVAGMAVAFPIGAGLALVIGAIINYAIAPKGNPILLFGGIGLICIAILLDAMAYRGLSGGAKASRKGIGLSLGCGVAVGLFYPFVAKALTGPHHLGPYTVYFVFALGAVVSNFPLNYGLMRRPVSGEKLRMKDYFQGRLSLHAWGVLGGAIWGAGTIANFVASYVPMIGPATSFSLGEGNTMISAIWGIFVWKEFHGAGSRVKVLLAIMFLFFVLGLSCIALAPIIP